jgi:SAM-dependent methyltransferase
MPRGVHTMLSAGCAGLWYFEWIRDAYGPVERHIGLEYYSPRPDGLPDGVEWIVNTVGDMSDVPDDTADLVFSGQNIEHLWPEEIVGFLAESARVLRPGGTLVVDSPNRLVTSRLGWTHPEHTIELSPTEAVELLRIAGFDVQVCRGVWQCADTPDDGIESLDASFDMHALIRRSVRAADDADHSFVWWIEATAGAAPVDRAAVRAFVDALFDRHWHDRVHRHARRPDGSIPPTVRVDSHGYRTAGFPLSPGQWTLSGSGDGTTATLERADGTPILPGSTTTIADGTMVATYDIDATIFDARIVVQRRGVPGTAGEVALPRVARVE